MRMSDRAAARAEEPEPHGGCHLEAQRADEDLCAHVVGFLPGLDVRGEGGYVVAPPSTHPTGKQYRWAPGCAPGEIELADAPAWLIDLIADRPRASARKPRSKAEQVRRRAEAYVAAAPGAAEGHRNQAAFELAGHVQAICGGNGDVLDEASVIDLLRHWNARCSPPLDDQELQRCVRNAATNGTPPPPKPPAQGLNGTELPPLQREQEVAGRGGEFSAAPQEGPHADWPEDAREEYEERAAIMEFEGGLSRQEAEILAEVSVRERWRQGGGRG